MDIQSLRADVLLQKLLAIFVHGNNSASAENTSFSSLITSGILFIILVGIIFVLFRVCLSIKKSLQEKSVLLELTPPATTEKTSYTTQQLFSVIHSLGSQKTLIDKLLGRKILFTFEIASTQNQGIRYLLRCGLHEVNNVKRSILSYLPHVEVKIVDEYLPDATKVLPNDSLKVIEFKLSRHFAYPLQKQDMLYEHDPVAYITGMMTKLLPEELISFQIVLSPTKRKEAKKLSKMILRNEDVLNYIDKIQFPSYLAPVSFLLVFINRIMHVLGSQIQWALTEVTRDTSRRSAYAYQTYPYSSQIPPNPAKPARVLSTFEEKAIKSVQEKIDQSLFETSLRVLVIMKDKNNQKERLHGFISSLSTFSVPKYQSLNKKHNFPPFIVDKLRYFSFRKRLLSLILNNSSSLLSVSEISDLYHFPFTIRCTPLSRQ